MKILIVDPDVMRVPELKLALATNGVQVTVAPSGSFALTMLEWNRHEVVVSRARIDDMEGHELCAILKSDPGTRDVRFVLVAGNDEVSAAQTTAAGVDLVLPPTLPAGAMVPHVLRLIPAPAPAPPVTPAAPPPAPVPAPSPARAAVAPAAPVVRPPAPPPVRPAAPAPARPIAPAPSRTAAPAHAPAAPAPVTHPAPRTPVAAPVPVVPVAVPAPPTHPEPTAPVVPAAPAPVAPPEPPPAVPKLRPDPVAAPTADPPKRYVTAAAAAAAAPWSKTSGPPAAAPAPAPAPAPAINLDAMPSGTFQGSLEVMDLAELTQAIAMGGKNGRLILALPQGGGVVAFEAGRVVHAEYRGTVGEPAFAALLGAAQADAAGRFCFLPSAAGEKPSPNRTIDKPVDRLLLSIATAIDEKG